MLFVLLSKRFLHMTVLAGFAFVAIRANLLDCYNDIGASPGDIYVYTRTLWQSTLILCQICRNGESTVLF